MLKAKRATITSNSSSAGSYRERLDATDLERIDVAFMKFIRFRYRYQENAMAVIQEARADFKSLLVAGALPTILLNPETGLRICFPEEDWCNSASHESLFVRQGGLITKKDGPGLAAYSGYLVMVDKTRLNRILWRDDLDISVLVKNRMLWPPEPRGPEGKIPKKPGRKSADRVVAQHAEDLWGNGWRKRLSKMRDLKQPAGAIQDSITKCGEQPFASRTIKDALRRLINSGN